MANLFAEFVYQISLLNLKKFEEPAILLTKIENAEILV